MTSRFDDDLDDDRAAQLYRDAIASVSTAGHLDPELARATLRRRRERRQAAMAMCSVVVLAALLIVLPRAFVERSLIAVPPPVATPTTAPEPTMIIDPPTARPGTSVTLRFPTQIQRGVAFTLQSLNGTDWQIDYYLISNAQERVLGGRRWFRPGEPGTGWFDVAVAGPGGEQVQIPDVAAPRIYRLCTSNRTADTLCSTITVVP